MGQSQSQPQTPPQSPIQPTPAAPGRKARKSTPPSSPNAAQRLDPKRTIERFVVLQKAYRDNPFPSSSPSPLFKSPARRRTTPPRKTNKLYRPPLAPKKIAKPASPREEFKAKAAREYGKRLPRVVGGTPLDFPDGPPSSSEPEDGESLGKSPPKSHTPRKTRRSSDTKALKSPESSPEPDVGLGINLNSDPTTWVPELRKTFGFPPFAMPSFAPPTFGSQPSPMFGSNSQLPVGGPQLFGARAREYAAEEAAGRAEEGTRHHQQNAAGIQENAKRVQENATQRAAERRGAAAETTGHVAEALGGSQGTGFAQRLEQLRAKVKARRARQREDPAAEKASRKPEIGDQIRAFLDHGDRELEEIDRAPVARPARKAESGSARVTKRKGSASPAGPRTPPTLRNSPSPAPKRPRSATKRMPSHRLPSETRSTSPSLSPELERRRAAARMPKRTPSYKLHSETPSARSSPPAPPRRAVTRQTPARVYDPEAVGRALAHAYGAAVRFRAPLGLGTADEDGDEDMEDGDLPQQEDDAELPQLPDAMDVDEYEDDEPQDHDQGASGADPPSGSEDGTSSSSDSSSDEDSSDEESHDEDDEDGDGTGNGTGHGNGDGNGNDNDNGEDETGLNASPPVSPYRRGRVTSPRSRRSPSNRSPPPRSSPPAQVANDQGDQGDQGDQAPLPDENREPEPAPAPAPVPVERSVTAASGTQRSNLSSPARPSSRSVESTDEPSPGEGEASGGEGEASGEREGDNEGEENQEQAYGEQGEQTQAPRASGNLTRAERDEAAAAWGEFRRQQQKRTPLPYTEVPTDCHSEIETSANAAQRSQSNAAFAAGSRRQSTRRLPFEEVTPSPATVQADRFVEVDSDDYEPADLQDYEEFTPPTVGHNNTPASPSPVVPAYSPTQRRDTAASGAYSPSMPNLPRRYTRFDASSRSPRLRSQSRRRSSSRRTIYNELEPESSLYDPAAVSFNPSVRNPPLNGARYSPNSPQLSRGTLFSSRRRSNVNDSSHLTGLGITFPVDENEEVDDAVPHPVRGRRRQASQEELEQQEVRSASIERRRRSTEQREQEIEERRARVWAEVMVGPHQSKSVPSMPSSSQNSKPRTPSTPRKISREAGSVNSPVSPSRRAAQQARIRAVLDEAGRNQHVDMSQTVADITRAQREAREAEFAAAGSPGILKPCSPSYRPTTPRRRSQSPAYALKTPRRRSQSPAYAPASHRRYDLSPSYTPASPYEAVQTPSYAPGTPQRSTRPSMGPPPVPSVISRRNSTRPAVPSPLSRRHSQRDDCNVPFPGNGRTEADLTALRQANAALRERVFELEHHVQELEAELEAVRGEDALMSGALLDDEEEEYDEEVEIVAPPKKAKKTAAKPTAKKAAAKPAAKNSAKRKADAAFVESDAGSELSAPAPKKAKKATAKKPATAAAEEGEAPRRSARVQQKAATSTKGKGAK